eukprot:TRINITY_DN79667_c0_g1_i1.p1 TRINITY_DN79667_c0_g1~~TRINITY_DN79667_c0_g1_i1.p1  ORF type:complete len:157 (-),score=8.21 TRINITY_DN79667_c0_g1_i1:361-831(-)
MMQLEGPATSHRDHSMLLKHQVPGTILGVKTSDVLAERRSSGRYHSQTSPTFHSHACFSGLNLSRDTPHDDSTFPREVSFKEDMCETIAITPRQARVKAYRIGASTREVGGCKVVRPIGLLRVGSNVALSRHLTISFSSAGSSKTCNDESPSHNPA